MTRDQFIEDVTDWHDLLGFCADNDCPVCENIYDESSRDDIINDMLSEWARNDSWVELRDRLRYFPDYDGYFEYNDYGEFVDVDNDRDFEYWKDDVLTWGDENGIWDDDTDEEDEPDVAYEPAQDDEPEYPPIEYEGFTPSDLFAASGEVFASIEVPDSEPEPEPQPEPQPAPQPTPQPVLEPLESLQILLS